MKNFKTIEPDESLKQYIRYYYFQEIEEPDYRHEFTFYPNYYVALNTFIDAEVKWSDEKRYTLPSKNHSTTMITFSKERSIVVEEHGPLKKMGVIFMPLGINYFHEEALSDIITGTITAFPFQGRAYLRLSEDVFKEKNMHIRKEMVDAFFMKNLKQKDFGILREAIDTILDCKGQISVVDLCHKLNTSVRTLERKCSKHLCIAPKSFIMLVRFRSAVEVAKEKGREVSMTELAYESNYYDQPAFNNEIQKFSGSTPRQLFKNKTDVGGKYTFWTSF